MSFSALARDELQAKIFNVSVIGESKQPYAVYEIEVTLSALNWTIKKRFSEFYEFNKVMRNNYPMLRDSLVFPSRFQKSLDPNFLIERKVKLNAFLKQLLSLAPLATDIRKCEPLILFFDIAMHLRKSVSVHRQSVARSLFPDIYSSPPPGRPTTLDAKTFDMNGIEGNSPIHSAAENGLFDEVVEIIKYAPGVVLLRDQMGQTPLHYATRFGQSHIVRLLLSHGSLINTQDLRGWSPLQNACVSKDIQCVLTLLEEESLDVTLQNTDGNTALHYLARNFENVDDSMAKTCVKTFLDRKANINAQNKAGETPLHNACWKSCLNFVKALICYGANPNIPTKSNESPLHWAAREQNEKIIYFLIQHGADVNMKELFSPAMNYPMVLTVYNEIKDKEKEIGGIFAKKGIGKSATCSNLAQLDNNCNNINDNNNNSLAVSTDNILSSPPLFYTNNIFNLGDSNGIINSAQTSLTYSCSSYTSAPSSIESVGGENFPKNRNYGFEQQNDDEDDDNIDLLTKIQEIGNIERNRTNSMLVFPSSVG